MLEEVIFFDTLRQALWTAVVVSTPILAVALVVGVSVGLLQALTSVQEMTLTFVPKLVAIVAVFWASMGFMTASIVTLFQSQIIPLIVGG
ncbi:flagellar biosynthetic protein FliQ [Aliishimia ponticola]|uniref:Flagellar biosynthetic protein FliQ n=1 Tax=Aliishimia ponticola TaxID=2499833 RepID=A0A4S4N800_9RHOB|nr:flagellar biosynthetic protein FliQ [Aliishimia ponticola]THH35314.1 flagellar biosynthetic protein FliQ [Aliishimia ponticola]